MMKRNYTNILLAGGLILMAAVARIVNAEMALYNFAPVAALGLFSGAIVKDKRYAFLFAILAQLAGDVYFALFTETQGFYGISQILTYTALVAVTFLGIAMKQPGAIKILGFSLAGTAVFFIISNFGHFVHGWNGYSWEGLVKTYVDAIAFYKRDLSTEAGLFPVLARIFLPDLISATVLFGAYYLLQTSLTTKVVKSKI